MSYHEELAHRIRMQLAGEAGLTEKRMFGGLAFLAGGRMFVCASSGSGLMLRVDPTPTEALLSQPHAQRFVMRGRELDGWLHIDPGGLATDEQLAHWITHGLTYARSLPPK